MPLLNVTSRHRLSSSPACYQSARPSHLSVSLVSHECTSFACEAVSCSMRAHVLKRINEKSESTHAVSSMPHMCRFACFGHTSETALPRRGCHAGRVTHRQYDEMKALTAHNTVHKGVTKRQRVTVSVIGMEREPEQALTGV